MIIKHPLTVTAAAIAVLASAQPAFATDYEVRIVNLTRGLHFTPVLIAAHPGNISAFSSGSTASAGIQAMAEGGATADLAAELESAGAGTVAGTGPIAPGASETLTISNTGTESNDHLSAFGMLLPTNDGFMGLNTVSLPTGEIGTSVSYTALGYDAGTEANDEIVGSGASGEPGFPAPPFLTAGNAVAIGSGGTGVAASAEGFVHVHRNNLGDNDAAAGVSNINSTVHRWLNPVARIIVTITGN